MPNFCIRVPVIRLVFSLLGSPRLEKVFLALTFLLLVVLLSYRYRARIGRVNKLASEDARRKRMRIINTIGYIWLWFGFLTWCAVLVWFVANKNSVVGQYHIIRGEFSLAGRAYERQFEKLRGRHEDMEGLLTLYLFGGSEHLAGTFKMMAIACFWEAGEYEKVVRLGFGDPLEWMQVVRAYIKLGRYNEARLYMKAIVRQWNTRRPMTKLDQQYFYEWVEKCIQRGGELEPMSKEDEQRTLETIKKIAGPEAFEWLEETRRRK